MKTFAINDPVYNADIQVFVNANAHDLDKWGKKILGCKIFPDEWKCMSGGVSRLTLEGLSDEAMGVMYIVWFGEEKPTMATIVHEAFHLTAMVLDDRLVEFDPNNQEPFAYYLDFLFRQLALKLPTSKIG